MSHLEGYTFDHIAESPANLSSIVDEDDELRATTSSIWRLLGLTRLIRTENDYVPLSSPHVRSRRRQGRGTRECRRSYVLRNVRRAVVTSPIVILAAFGVLHLLQFLIGRSRLFWNTIEFPTEPRTARFDLEKFRPGGEAPLDVLPIPCHSHNDYWRREPLFDALRWGCTGVEADIWLFDEELYVGHTVSSLRRDRTLRSLYIDRLLELLDRMNEPQNDFVQVDSVNGVFSRKPEQTLTLLVDFKNRAHEVFPILQKQLQPLREKDYLTHWNGQEIVPRAITVVASGDAPFDLIVENSTYRDIFFDAPLNQLCETPRTPINKQDALPDQLDSHIDYGHAMSLPLNTTIINPDDFSTNNSYYASVSFASTVGFVWRGHLSPRQMEIIRGQIRGAKRRGLKARYWNTPSWPIALRNHIWHVLIKEGVDMLSVDDLGAAAKQSWTDGEQSLW